MLLVQTNPPFTKGSMLYLGLSLLVMPAVPCILYMRIYHFVNNSAKKMKSQYSRPSSSNSADHDSRSLSRGGRCNSQTGKEFVQCFFFSRALENVLRLSFPLRMCKELLNQQTSLLSSFSGLE